jgi:hypothetical protein
MVSKSKGGGGRGSVTIPSERPWRRLSGHCWSGVHLQEIKKIDQETSEKIAVELRQVEAPQINYRTVVQISQKSYNKSLSKSAAVLKIIEIKLMKHSQLKTAGKIRQL